MPDRNLKDGKALVSLEDGVKALYIGSGPFLKNVRHMTRLVDSTHYVLSDLEFEGEETVQFGDCRVTATNKDGFKLIKEEKIGFVMVDNALLGRLEEAYKNIEIGSCIYVHETLPDSTPFGHEICAERLGLEKVKGNLYRKGKEASNEDFEISYKIMNVEQSLAEISLMPNKKPAKPSANKDAIQELAALGIDISTEDLENAGPALYDAAGQIISATTLRNSASGITESARYLASRANEREKAFVKAKLAEAHDYIDSMNNPFYSELNAALKDAVEAL